MSASLVGSEMCIRDRAPGARARARRGSGGPAAVCAGAGGQIGRGRPGAVSYTHLTLPTICSV
eukprot:11884934-Alexandrium_andersonii.AAC.1